MERGNKMASSKSNTWLRKMIDVGSLPRIRLNNLQDLPGAKKKVRCVCALCNGQLNFIVLWLVSKC